MKTEIKKRDDQHIIKDEIFINLEINYYCELDCKYCYMRTRQGWQTPQKHLTYTQIVNLVKKMKILKLKKYFKFMGGEPTEHPEIKKILQYFLDNNIPFDLSTNGLFNEDLLEFFIKNDIQLTFSLHFNTLNNKELYKKFRYNFEKINPEYKFLNIIIFDKRFDNLILPLIKHVHHYNNYAVNLLHNTEKFKTKNFEEKAKESELYSLIPFMENRDEFQKRNIICYFPKIDINPDNIIITQCFSPSINGIYDINDLIVFKKLSKFKQVPQKKCKICSYLNNNDLNVLEYFEKYDNKR